MSDIPESAVEAVVDWIGSDSVNSTLSVAIDRSDIKNILEAAMPHIRAQIAEQIRGLEWTRAEVSEYMQDGVSTDYIAGRSGAISNAARIAEGSGE